MTKLLPNTKAKVAAITYPEGMGMNQVKRKKIILYTTQGLEKALADIKYRFRTTKDSEKLKALKINVDLLEITFLRNSTLGKVESDVNFFINEYDTLNNGWNSILR